MAQKKKTLTVVIEWTDQKDFDKKFGTLLNMKHPADSNAHVVAMSTSNEIVRVELINEALDRVDSRLEDEYAVKDTLKEIFNLTGVAQFEKFRFYKNGLRRVWPQCYGERPKVKRNAV